MDGATHETVSRFHHAFAKGGVGVNDVGQVSSSSFEAEDGTAFTDQVGGVGTDDMDTEDLSVRFIRDDLEETGDCFADDARLAKGRQGELGDLDLVSCFTGGIFGQAHP